MSFANSVVLVAGASGVLGKLISVALLDSKKFKEVRLLIRPESLQDEKKKSEIEQFKAKGAVIVAGDAMKPETLNFTGVDVVVSAVSQGAMLQGQLNLIEASKKYGVKRYIPSEFGVDISKIDIAKYPLFGGKVKVREVLNAGGLDYTIILTGMFLETITAAWLGIDIANNKAIIPGE